MARVLRSPLAWPALLIGTVVGALGLTFSDRAPGIVKAIVVPVRAAAPRIERALGINWVDRSDVPFANDTLGHMAMWALISALTIIAIRGRVPTRWLVAALVLAASVSEYAQPLLSSSRSMSASDFGGNLMGITIGVVVGSIAHWLMRTRLIRWGQSSLA